MYVVLFLCLITERFISVYSTISLPDNCEAISVYSTISLPDNCEAISAYSTISLPDNCEVLKC